MSKRKRASLGKTPGTPPSSSEGDEANDDASVRENMVHVAPDLLAGSPDIFAGKKAETGEAPEFVSESIDESTPAEPTEPEPPEASTMLTPPEPEPPPTESPSTPAPPPFVNASAHPAPARRGGSSTALGIVLVVIGLFALLIVLSGVDLTESGWPLFIIIPGLTLIVVGFLWVGAVATIPGGIVTMLGVVLAYSNSTGDWPFWAYGWALVVPFGVGLGMYMQALRDRDQHALRTGRTLIFIGLMIFLIGFVLFESILGISGRDYFGPVGKAALPALLILVGVILLVRSVQRGRKT
ncbi:MAG: hypothetical protein E6I67_00145 [Chloroflexi bacterium]|nr:MAG: hypothetical protein E6I67_00145 [Chloroflexota bacterium]